MKKIISVFICLISAVTLSLTAGAKTPDAYIDNGNLKIEYFEGMSETAVAAYYNGSSLCGAYLGKTDGKTYTVGMPERYTKIRVWFTDTDETVTIHIADKTAAAPDAAASPTAIPTAEPTSAPERDDIDGTDTPYSEDYHGEKTDVTDKAEETSGTCVFSVECFTAVSSDTLSDELRSILPADGIIAPAVPYEISEGMSVYDVLTAAADEYGFELSGSESYISAVGGLGEFDCGPKSGWMYSVNGEIIMAPINVYKVRGGDEIRMMYTCDLGNDLGNDLN